MHDTPLQAGSKRDSQPSQKTPLLSGEPVACPTATIPAEAVRVRESHNHTSRQTKDLTDRWDFTSRPLPMETSHGMG